jgi:hypothetical protein
LNSIFKIGLYVIGFIIFIGCDGSSSAISNSTTANTTISKSIDVVVPTYFYDQDEWNSLYDIIDENASNKLILVINPDNGVGDGTDLDHYSDIIDTLKNKKQKTIGYISTQYTQRNIDDIKDEIDDWLRLYPNIQGYFLDEIDRHEYEFYQDLYDYIKSKGDYYIVLNAGAKVDSKYYDSADKVIVYENNLDEIDYLECVNDKDSAIIYGIDTKEDAENLLNTVKCDSLFITDRYDYISSYFDDLYQKFIEGI